MQILLPDFLPPIPVPFRIVHLPVSPMMMYLNKYAYDIVAGQLLSSLGDGRWWANRNRLFAQLIRNLALVITLHNLLEITRLEKHLFSRPPIKTRDAMTLIEGEALFSLCSNQVRALRIKIRVERTKKI